MSSQRKTKKNISSTPSNEPKINKNKRTNKGVLYLGKSTSSNNKEQDLIESLLNKGKSKSNSYHSNQSKNINFNPPKKIDGRQSLKNKLETGRHRQNRSKKDKMMYNFHHAINSTNSDQIIVKMLELNENDILNFYSNLEKMIGKDLSAEIRQEMSRDIRDNQKKTGGSMAICPFCQENKSNCVILLCGHLICHKCGKNINRCKYPCPKCKKPIKYIQFITD